MKRSKSHMSPERHFAPSIRCSSASVPRPAYSAAAIQAGEHAADNILAMVAVRPTEPFAYFDKGIMATIGRASGIAQAGSMKLRGFIGWLAWLFIHLLYLIGFRNRLVVLIQWAWAYVTYGRSARLITGTSPDSLDRTMLPEKTA